MIGQEQYMIMVEIYIINLSIKNMVKQNNAKKHISNETYGVGWGLTPALQQAMAAKI